MEFQWRNVDFEVRRRARGERRLIVPWPCVNVFVISHWSRLEVLLSPSMVRIDDRNGPRWLLVPNQSVLVYYSRTVFLQGVVAGRTICFAQVELSVITPLQLLHCGSYSVEDDFGLESRLMTHDRVLMYLLSAVIADIDELGLLYNTRGTWFHTATYIVSSDQLRDFVYAAMSLSSAVGWLPYSHVNGSVHTKVNCLRIDLVRRERSLSSLAQPKRDVAVSFHIVDGVLIPPSLDDHPPLLLRALVVSPSGASFMWPVAMNETSSCSLRIVAEPLADFDRPYLLAGYYFVQLSVASPGCVRPFPR